jgi:hypothetical protein
VDSSGHVGVDVVRHNHLTDQSSVIIVWKGLAFGQEGLVRKHTLLLMSNMVCRSHGNTQHPHKPWLGTRVLLLDCADSFLVR